MNQEVSAPIKLLEILPALKRALVLIFVLVSGMVLGALAFAYVFAGEIYDYQDTVDGVHLPPVDAVVCLAGGKGRIVASGDIWYRYWEQGKRYLETKNPDQPAPVTPVLYISGMGPQSTWNVFARQLRRGVLEVIRPENVVLETESSNTEANAQWLAKYAQSRGWQNVLLVTSSYHMRRARMIFEHVLKEKNPELKVATLSIFQEPFEPGEWRAGLHGIRVTVTEYIKWIYYRTLWRPSSP
jgi:uncharacterized SAM-binding protein YcdF (DUF218 family)